MCMKANLPLASRVHNPDTSLIHTFFMNFLKHDAVSIPLKARTQGPLNPRRPRPPQGKGQMKDGQECPATRGRSAAHQYQVRETEKQESQPQPAESTATKSTQGRAALLIKHTGTQETWLGMVAGAGTMAPRHHIKALLAVPTLVSHMGAGSNPGCFTSGPAPS